MKRPKKELSGACQRCGQCCLSTAIRVSPQQLEKYYKAWKAGKKGQPTDIDLLFPMLEPLGYDKKVKRWRYTCKHFLVKDGKGGCSIYKHRPKMCRDYGVTEMMQMGVEGSYNRRLYPDCVF